MQNGQREVKTMEKVRAWLALTLGGGLILLLGGIVAIDAIVSLREHRPLDSEISNLLSQALTGIIGLLAGWMSNKNNNGVEKK